MSELEELKKKVHRLEIAVRNHMKHPKTISVFLAYIRDKGLVHMNEMRKEYPTLYGGNLSRLYDAIRGYKDDFEIFSQKGRSGDVIIAYLPKLRENNPIKLHALDYFKRINQRNKGIATPTEMQRIYNLTAEDTKTAFSLFTDTFSSWLQIRPNGKQAMTKEQYAEYSKKLKATGRRY